MSRYKMGYAVLISILSFTTIIGQIYAQNIPFESPNRLAEVAKNFVRTQVHVDNGNQLEIDAPLNNFAFEVPHCSSDIIASIPPASTLNSLHAIDLQCLDSRPWKVQAPIKIAILSNVVIVKHLLSARTRISADDLDIAKYDKNSLFDGYFTNKNEVIGKEASRVLTAGSIVSSKNIKAPSIIKSNQIVQLVASRGAVNVTMKGIAREEGAINAIIKVYNPLSRKLVDAIVTGPGQVQGLG